MIIANVVNVINYCNVVSLCFPKSNIINKYYDRQPPKANINYENCSKLISAIVQWHLPTIFLLTPTITR